MIIEKYLNDNGTYDIDIKDSGKILSLFIGGVDPNFSCRYETWKPISEISFNIPSSSQELYPWFVKLYHNIISGNVLGASQEDSSTLKQMEYQKSFSWYHDIVQDQVITILSDAYPIDCPNILKISQNTNTITLTFIKVDGQPLEYLKSPYSITINIRQDGSKSHDFCIPFKTLYKDLQAIPETPKAKKRTRN